MRTWKEQVEEESVTVGVRVEDALHELVAIIRLMLGWSKSGHPYLLGILPEFRHRSLTGCYTFSCVVKGSKVHVLVIKCHAGNRSQTATHDSICTGGIWMTEERHHVTTPTRDFLCPRLDVVVVVSSPHQSPWCGVWRVEKVRKFRLPTESVGNPTANRGNFHSDLDVVTSNGIKPCATHTNCKPCSVDQKLSYNR